jgi:cell division protein FtsA
LGLRAAFISLFIHQLFSFSFPSFPHYAFSPSPMSSPATNHPADKAADKIVVGLDIGTTKICATVGRLNEYGKLEILGMGKAPSEGVSQGQISNIDKTVAGIQAALAEAEKQSGIDIKVVNVGIAGQHIKGTAHHGSIMRNTHDDEVSVDDIKRLNADMYRMLTPHGTQIIHVMAQEYTVDNIPHIKDPVGMSGVKLEGDFQVITAHVNAIHNINKCVHRAGLEIDQLMLEPIASSMAVLSEEEKEAGVALIDIGGGTTDLAIFYDGILRHTAVIPYGGNIITKDIREGCMIMEAQAETLKTKFGIALSEEAKGNEVVSIPGLRNRTPKEISVRNLAHIIGARMEEIFELLHTEIILSGYEQKLAGGIVLTGGGAQLQSIKHLAELMTGLDCRIGHPNEHLGRTKTELVKSPGFATSVGLVLAGFKSIDERENQYARHTRQAQPANGGPSLGGRDYKNDQTTGKRNRLKQFLDMGRSFLIDDVNDKGSY